MRPPKVMQAVTGNKDFFTKCPLNISPREYKPLEYIAPKRCLKITLSPV